MIKYIRLFVILFMSLFLSVDSGIYSKNPVLPNSAASATTHIEETNLGMATDDQVYETIPTVSTVTTDADSEIVAIKVNADNVKTEYLLNEELDLSGLIVSVVYDSGEERKLSEFEYFVSSVDMFSFGEKELVVSYGKFSDSFIVTVSYSYVECEPHVMYTTARLNLRNGPGKGFDIMAVAPLGGSLTVLGEVDNGWVKVRYQGGEYYCVGSYLDDNS